MIDLTDLANRYRQSNPAAGPLQRAEFLVNVMGALRGPKALACDALPFTLKRSTNEMSNMQPRSTRPASIDRRFSRDQSPVPMSSPGSFSAGIDQGGGSGPLDLQTAASCVEWMLSQMQGPDQPAFLAFLRNLGSESASDAGLRRGRSAMRRQAQDSALTPRSQRAFLQRFPEAKGIRLSSSWRD